MRCEQHKVRESKISEDDIKKIADVLKKRYLSFAEIQRLAKGSGLGSGIESFLSLFNVRGYLITEITVDHYNLRSKQSHKKTLYKIVTEEDYNNYDEEVHKDAKRRLLAAVSY